MSDSDYTDDLYIVYWSIFLEAIKDHKTKEKLEREIKDRLTGLKNDTKCHLLGGKCMWPCCELPKRFDKGYCAP